MQFEMDMEAFTEDAMGLGILGNENLPKEIRDSWAEFFMVQNVGKLHECVAMEEC